MAARDDRQLMADLVRAEYPDAILEGFAPDFDDPVIVADDVAAWLGAQVSNAGQATQVAKGARTATYIASYLADGPLNMAPVPYSRFWIEARINYEGGWYRMGEHVIVLGHDEEAGALAIEVSGWIQNQFGIQPPEWTSLYHQEADGTIDLHRHNLIDDPDRQGDERSIRWNLRPTRWAGDIKHDGNNVIDVGDYPEAQMSILHVQQVLAVCAFMICRNIRPEPVDIPPRVARKRAKALGLAEPTVSYSRLRLPGFQRWRTTSQTAAGAGAQAMPVHLVRAHPKTYRRNLDGTGGLGRWGLEGTWLWSPQVRGARDAGQRIPHITVAPSNEHEILKGPDHD